MARLQSEPIDVHGLIESSRGDADGALALFVGKVRDRNQGRRVLFLEYHAYEAMARREMEAIEAEIRRSFAVSSVEIVHRTGRLRIGEASVAVVVAAPHRAPAIEACRFAIDTLKRTVPIWKREHFEGGKVWIEGQGPNPSGGS